MLAHCHTDRKLFFKVCFDKTGTLTEDGLNFHSARPIIRDAHKGPVFDVESNILRDDFMVHHWRLIEAMASCHTLTRYSRQL